MKHGTRKKKLKQRLMRPLAGLLAAGLLLCGGGAALAAANFDLGNNGTPINIGAGPYGDMVMYGATAANPHVEVASSLTTAFQNLIIQGGGGNGIYAGIESTVGALTFAGNATITAGSGNNEWASFQTNTNITFTTGTVTVTGNMLNGAVFAVTNGATVTAGGGFQAGTGGNINLGSTGIGSGTLVGNVTLAGASGDPGRLKVGDDASKVIGNVTVGIIGGGEGSLQLFDGDESAPVFKSFTITGNLVLNNLQRGAAVTLPGSPSQTVIVGAGTTLTVGGSVAVNNDSILALAGTLQSNAVSVQDSGKLVSTDD
ncbi:MAG: hypothetical protein LBI88_04185, partial [Deltaproteobacteria bacterium]|nr:hypothetical protein [Deltaproteobacteria bacterium]